MFGSIQFLCCLKFYSILMKRTSERITSNRQNICRKYPSAYFKHQNFIQTKPYIPHPLSSTLAISQTICQQIMQKVQHKIQQYESQKFLKKSQSQSNFIHQLAFNASQPLVEINYSLITSQQEPNQITPDIICSGDLHFQKKEMKREVCISACASPLKELRREKYSTSHKQFPFHTRKSIKKQLVPLTPIESQHDIRSTLIQTFYREKFAKQDEANQEESVLKPQINKMFRKTNPKDKEQFAFDYDGEKIPIIGTNNRKNNPIKILKTVYKVHKDKVETKLIKKMHENFRSSKLPETGASMKLFEQNGTDVHELRRGIEQSVRWAGKLQSIKMINELDEKK